MIAPNPNPSDMPKVIAEATSGRDLDTPAPTSMKAKIQVGAGGSELGRGWEGAVRGPGGGSWSPLAIAMLAAAEQGRAAGPLSVHAPFPLSLPLPLPRCRGWMARRWACSQRARRTGRRPSG
jgi:hypothetical protein